MKRIKLKELRKLWRQLDGCCEALDRLSHHEQGQELLKNHENRIDFSAIVNLKNDIELEIESRGKNL